MADPAGPRHKQVLPEVLPEALPDHLQPCYGTGGRKVFRCRLGATSGVRGYAE
jgi:hypothetical protein